MQTLKQRALLLAAGFAVLCSPAMAWGPAARRAIVDSAMQVTTREGTAPLNRLATGVRKGAGLSRDELREVFPGFERAPWDTIRQEILLLQAVQDDRVDQYMAYRLGALGALVAEATSPLAYADDNLYRARYEEAADERIGRVSLETAPRRIIDSEMYFTRIEDELRGRQELILEDYRRGVSFEQGVAGSLLPRKVSLSVNTVADVWHTILRGSVVAAGISDEQVRQYLLEAVRFYLDENSDEGARNVRDRIRRMRIDNIDFRQELGDAFFEAGKYEWALDEYERILEQAPDRRQVRARVANYYVQEGDEALDANRLEDAQSAFRQAVAADQLHPEAPRRLLEAERRIEARQERLAAARADLADAQDLERQAEEEARRGNPAVAVDLLRRAREVYAGIPQEFPNEARQAMAGVRNVEQRMNEMRDTMVASAQGLSGGAFRSQPLVGVDTDFRGYDESALEGIIEREYRQAMDELARRLDMTERDELLQ